MTVEFTLFPSLPQELRLKIWEASFTSRIVEICQKNDPGYDEVLDVTDTGPPADLYSPTPLPALLTVNRESRSVVIKASLPDFPTPDNAQRIFYNSEIDILYFPAWCWRRNISIFEEAVPDESKSRIKRIALGELQYMNIMRPDIRLLRSR